MPDERLLERLATVEQAPRGREGSDHRRLTASILSHLRHILNTRHGAVPIAPNYGVPDFLDFLQRYPDSLGEMEASIAQAIERYEPRLERVQVSFTPQDDDALSLRFQIQAEVCETGTAKVSFETLVESDGRVSVRQ